MRSMTKAARTLPSWWTNASRGSKPEYRYRENQRLFRNYVPRIEALEDRNVLSGGGAGSGYQAQFLSDPGFETPAVGTGNVLYNPATSPWSFSGSAGLT